MASQNMQAYERLMKLANFEEDITSDQARQAMYDAYTEDFEIIEPDSLPHGGVYKGREAWLGMNEHMRSLWEQKVKPRHIWEVPEADLIVLYTDMEWIAKETGRTTSFPAIELLYFRDGLICKVEMFLQDTKIILDTLKPA